MESFIGKIFQNFRGISLYFAEFSKEINEIWNVKPRYFRRNFYFFTKCGNIGETLSFYVREILLLVNFEKYQEKNSRNFAKTLTGEKKFMTISQLCDFPIIGL